MNSSILSPERAPRRLHTEGAISPLRRSYFSDLIEALFLSEPEPLCRPIMFTSTHRGSGVSFVATYISTELASLGHPVLLVDAQTVVRLALRPAEEARKQPERIDMSRLWVLGHKQMVFRAGPRMGQAGSTDKTAASSAGSVLAALREDFSHVIIDAPALSASDDAITLASAVHGTVFVASRGTVARQEIVRTQERFVSLGGRVLGSIYNDRPDDSTGGSRA